MGRPNKQEQRFGEEKLNNQGCLMKIARYNDANDIVVEFQDEYKAMVHASYGNFLTGDIKNPYYPSVYGVGIIGDKYPSRVNKKSIKEYAIWHNMLQRCYDNDIIQKRPTYKDVVCCKEWLLYENFYEWLHSQENFEQWLNGGRWCLDKDILVKGNKIYSPETCCLVPIGVNSLFTKRDLHRGDLPIGIQRVLKKYRASFNTINGHTNFPVRSTINEAFEDYKEHKEETIKQVAQEEYIKGNITKRCYEAMMNYEVEIID